MDKLTNEELMRIIVNLDASYKKELLRSSTEIACLTAVYLEETCVEVEMKKFDRCYLCQKYISNYRAEFEDQEDYAEDTENIYECSVCAKNTCVDCQKTEIIESESSHSSIINRCTNCNDIHAKVHEIKDLCSKFDKK